MPLKIVFQINEHEIIIWMWRIFQLANFWRILRNLPDPDQWRDGTQKLQWLKSGDQLNCHHLLNSHNIKFELFKISNKELTENQYKFKQYFRKKKTFTYSSVPPPIGGGVGAQPLRWFSYCPRDGMQCRFVTLRRRFAFKRFHSYNF